MTLSSNRTLGPVTVVMPVIFIIQNLQGAGLVSILHKDYAGVEWWYYNAFIPNLVRERIQGDLQ